MSATSIIATMQSLLARTEALPLKVAKILPSDDQWDSMITLAVGLSKTARDLEKRVQTLKDICDERAWHETEEYLRGAQMSRDNLVAKGQLKNAAMFRRNITRIFMGPKESLFDTEDMKFRNATTRKRCELIRGLTPDGIVLWAISFRPTFWAGGTLASHVCSLLLDNIEPELKQTWPQTIRSILRILQKDEPALNTSTEYDSFLKALDSTSRDTVPSRKRRRIMMEEEVRDAGEPAQPAESLPPSAESRAMKHIYTNGPANAILKMPEPLKSFVQNSRLWKWEREQGLATTGCWSSVFPQDEKQDVSFTVWCGHEDGYQLNSMFGSQLVLSS